MRKERGRYPVTMMCRLLKVSKSGFYAAVCRPVSARKRENEVLRAKVVSIHRESRETYGSPRIRAELLESGFHHGRNRVIRLMRDQGLVGVKKRKSRSLTRRDERDPVAPNRLRQNFQASGPNEKWVADITYIRTDEGWLYLAIVLDLFSRRLVGWSMSKSLETPIVLDALSMALGRRRVSANLVHHSDKGCQYTSKSFRKALQTANIDCSMSGTGCCYDNAVAESFFSTLKAECCPRGGFVSRAVARTEIFDYIESFYNPRRRHSALGYLSPVRYEATHQPQRLAA